MHEHACTRCRFLRVDPAQLGRIDEMTENAEQRLVEAKDRVGSARSPPSKKASSTCARDKPKQSADLRRARTRSPRRRDNEAMKLPVMPPVSPMLAKSVPSIPPGASYEPKWDGFRSICFRDGDEVELGSRNERPMTRYFPELVAAATAELPERCVIDGEIVIATDHGLDFEALQQRIHPADSRVRMLAEQTPASFIAFDLLALGDDDYTQRPFSRTPRRPGRGACRPRPVVPRHARDHRSRRPRQRWFEEFEGAGLDGVIAKPLTITYQPDKRVMFKIKHERTADCVVAGYRVHKSGADAIGSLLLGLYKRRRHARLRRRHRGVPDGQATAALLRTCSHSSPHSMTTRGTGQPTKRGERTPRKNEGSRWNAGKDLSFVPCDRSAWSRSATTTWKANDSATPPSSTAGAPTATHAHAPTPNSNSHSPSASATSFPASAQATRETGKPAHRESDGTTPTNWSTPSCHCFGHRDMSFEAKLFRHRAVPIPEVLVGSVVTVRPRQQRAQPQQLDFV